MSADIDLATRNCRRAIAGFAQLVLCQLFVALGRWLKNNRRPILPRDIKSAVAQNERTPMGGWRTLRPTGRARFRIDALQTLRSVCERKINKAVEKHT